MTASTESFLNGRVTLHCGDCLDVLATLPECSVDSVVTDPPYHLTSIVKRFGSPTAKPVRVGDINATNDLKAAHARAAAGFMGKVWDGGDVAFRPETWAEVLRVLKPGGHLLAFGGTRTFARMSVAIEDAGFEVRDTIMWVYGSGFPKSHDVSKGIDAKILHGGSGSRQLKLANDGRPGDGRQRVSTQNNGIVTATTGDIRDGRVIKDESSTPEAAQWEGWGTALKPAVEPIVLARKPLSEATVAANVLRWGTGAINVGACRVGYQNEADMRLETRGVHAAATAYDGLGEDGGAFGGLPVGRKICAPVPAGRWPANLIHDGSEEVVGAFPDARSAGIYGNERNVSEGMFGTRTGGATFDDSGSAARFFYSAKADSDDRLGSKHPTVKPVDLMQYLVRLVTPPGGVCLDPFAGTGTTGEAAWREGMRAVLIEAEAEYQADVRRRMELALAGPDEKAHAIVKAKGLTEGPGPLFDWGGEYNAHRDVEGSFSEAYRAIRERKAAGGPGWEPK